MGRKQERTKGNAKGVGVITLEMDVREKQKHPSTRQLVGIHGNNGTAERVGGSGPIKAALQRLSCLAVTPGAMGIFPASSASLFIRRTSADLFSSFLHVALNVRPPSITISQHLPGSNATVFYPSPYDPEHP